MWKAGIVDRFAGVWDEWHSVQGFEAPQVSTGDMVDLQQRCRSTPYQNEKSRP